MKFHKERQSPRFELTSLIDIIFILLIFFMISSTFIKPATRLKLPVSATEDEIPKQDQVVVTLSAEDRLYVDTAEIGIDNFQPLIRERVEQSTNLTVLFYGDEEISYKKFLLIMDVLKSSGVKDIAIGHQAE